MRKIRQNGAPKRADFGSQNRHKGDPRPHPVSAVPMAATLGSIPAAANINKSYRLGICVPHRRGDEPPGAGQMAEAL